MHQETWELKREMWRKQQPTASPSNKEGSQTKTNTLETTASNVVDSRDHLPISEQN